MDTKDVCITEKTEFLEKLGYTVIEKELQEYNDGRFRTKDKIIRYKGKFAYKGEEPDFYLYTDMYTYNNHLNNFDVVYEKEFNRILKELVHGKAGQ